MNKRLEELKKAEARLSKLVQAAVEVANDSTACDMLREAASTHGVVVISADDLEHRSVIALAMVTASIEAERFTKSIPKESRHA